MTITTNLVEQKERVVRIRKRFGYSQKEMAEKMDIPRETYKYYERENGDFKARYLSAYEKLRSHDGLRVNIDWLLFEQGEMMLQDYETGIDRPYKVEDYDLLLDTLNENKELKQRDKEVTKKIEELYKIIADQQKKIDKFEGR